MLQTLFLINFVLTIFFLFLGSLLTRIIDPFVDPAWIEAFRDVASLNPTLPPEDVISGTILSYFTVAAILLTLLHIAREIKERGDIYNFEGALKEGALGGILSALAGILLRSLGLQQYSNTCVPVTLFLFEAKNNLRSAVVLFLSLILAALAINYISSLLRVDPLRLNVLYYVFLLVLPPVLAHIATSI